MSAKCYKQTLVRCGKILYVRSPRTVVIEILSAQCLGIVVVAAIPMGAISTNQKKQRLR